MNRIAFCDNKFERMKEKKRNFTLDQENFRLLSSRGVNLRKLGESPPKLRRWRGETFAAFAANKHSTFRIGEGGAVSHVDNYHRLGERERGIVLLRECALKFAHSSAQLTITGGVQWQTRGKMWRPTLWFSYLRTFVRYNWKIIFARVIRLIIPRYRNRINN